MGVVNVTPDSFSDGGEWFDPDAAMAHGLELSTEGADIVDVGGESTRPGRPAAGRRGAAPGGARSAALAEAGACVSIDTMRSEVVPAVAAGAQLVNDVSGGRADRELPTVGRARRPLYVHALARARRDMQSRATTPMWSPR